MSKVQIKKAYDPPAADDGIRVVVDRLWPRGLKRGEAGIDLWLKDVARSADLRGWFGHDPARWSGFQDPYRARQTSDAAVRRDTEHNNAIALHAVGSCAGKALTCDGDQP